jgi:hypothetical protein
LARERQWLKDSGTLQLRWETALTDIRAIADAKPKTMIREVLREGQTCPDISIDGRVFSMLDNAVTAANAARSEAPAGR